MVFLQLGGDSLLNEVVKQQAQINQTVLKVLDLVLQQQKTRGQVNEATAPVQGQGVPVVSVQPTIANYGQMPTQVNIWPEINYDLTHWGRVTHLP